MNKNIIFILVSICTLNSIGSESKTKTFNCDDPKEFELFYEFLQKSGKDSRKEVTEMSFFEKLIFSLRDDSNGIFRSPSLFLINNGIKLYEPATYSSTDISESAEAVLNCLRKAKKEYFKNKKEEIENVLSQEVYKENLDTLANNFEEFKKNNQQK